MPPSTGASTRERAERGVRRRRGRRPARPVRGAGAGRGRRRRRPDPRGGRRALRPPAALLQRHHHRADRRRECQERLAKRADRRARRRRPRRLVGAHLACCGIGEMLLVDFDRVELSNLNRQVLYSRGRHRPLQGGGRGRATRAFNSAMRVETRLQRLDSEAGSPRRSRATTSSSMPATGPPTTSSSWINSACFAAGDPLHRDEPLPAGRPGRAALRAGGDRLLHLPGDRLPAHLPALRRGDRAAARQSARRRRPWDRPAA